MYSLESNLLLRPVTTPPNIDINDVVTEAEIHWANCSFNWGSKSWYIPCFLLPAFFTWTGRGACCCGFLTEGGMYGVFPWLWDASLHLPWPWPWIAAVGGFCTWTGCWKCGGVNPLPLAWPQPWLVTTGGFFTWPKCGALGWDFSCTLSSLVWLNG